MLFHNCLAASLFSWLVLAQNNTGEANCPQAIEDLVDDDLTFNSSGTTPVAFLGQDLWHLSLAYEFQLARNTSIVRDTSSWANQFAFLSVPESLFDSNDSDEFQICYYQLDGINATSDSDALDSCDGVLSEECRDAILEAPLPIDGSCPSITISNDCGGPARLWTCLCSFSWLLCPAYSAACTYTYLSRTFQLLAARVHRRQPAGRDPAKRLSNTAGDVPRPSYFSGRRDLL